MDAPLFLFVISRCAVTELVIPVTTGVFVAEWLVTYGLALAKETPSWPRSIPVQSGSSSSSGAHRRRPPVGTPVPCCCGLLG